MADDKLVVPPSVVTPVDDKLGVPPSVVTPVGDDGKAANQTSSSDASSTRSARAEDDPEYGSTDNHIFSDPATAEHWRKIYEKSRYENRHRFDPGYKWTAEEEKKLVRKVGSALYGQNLTCETGEQY